MSPILNLRIRGPSSSAELAFDAALSLSELKNVIAEKLDLAFTEFELLWGFPIKKPDFDADEPINGKISNNEMIRVVLMKDNNLILPKKSIKKEKSHVISKTTSSSSQGLKSKINSNFSSNFSPNISTIFGPTRAINSIHEGQPSMTGRKRQRMTKMNASSQEDISIHLLEAVSGGSGKKNQFLRAAFRRAVELQYDQSTAHARVYSALSNTYRIEKCANIRRLGSGESTMMTVTFHKGFGSRLGTCIVETVDLMNIEQLKAVISLILQEKDEESRETLRTLHMAGCSPRTFWSIVHFYGGDVELGLKQLLPDVDWTWLQGRRRTLSEKAKMNLEQKQQLEKEKKSTRTSNNSSVLNEKVENEVDKDIRIMANLIQQQVNLANIIPIKYHNIILFLLHATSQTIPIISTSTTTTTKKNKLFTSTSSTTSTSFTETDIIAFIDMDINTLKQNLETALTTYQYNKDHKITIDMILDWLITAQRRCIDVWMQWFCHSDENITLTNNDINDINKSSFTDRVKNALIQLGIKGLGQMSVWRHAPEAILQEGSGLRILGLEKVKRMASICYKLRERFSWLTNEVLYFEVNGNNNNEEEDEEDEEGERNRLLSEGWLLYDPNELVSYPTPLTNANNNYLGCQVTIVQEDNDSDSNDNESEDQPIKKKNTSSTTTSITKNSLNLIIDDNKVDLSTYPDGIIPREVNGIIKAYLPATEEEPMALWKVWLEEGFGRQDLEEKEVIEACQRFHQRNTKLIDLTDS